MVVVKLMGGLGNQMFQYAFAKNLALKNKTTLKVDLSFLEDRTPRENFIFREYDLTIFDLKVEIINQKDLVNFCSDKPQSFFKKLFSKKKDFATKLLTEKKFSFEATNFINHTNILVEGYWQSEKYFREIESIIRSDFSFKTIFTKEEEKINKQIESVNSVCVNFRRTDFVHLKNSADTHGVLEMDYYEKAIMKISEAIENPHFFIFSDDIEWCIENIKWQFPITFVGHEYKGHKFSSYLQLMKNCKHFVIPNSTFAWWAAWLSQNEDKIVIAPKTWFKDQVLQDQTHDIIPEAWIRI